jgi:hypothetical protein
MLSEKIMIQNGKVITPDKQKITGHFEPGTILCPNDHVMGAHVAGAGVKDMPQVLYACYAPACEFNGIHYRFDRPEIKLEAVSD